MDNDDKFNSHSEDTQDLAPDTLRHSGHWSLGIGHTGNPSDHEHSVHQSQSVRPDTVDHWSILLNRTLLELRSELELWSASLESDVVLMFSSSSRRDNSTYRAAIPLRHADPGEHFLASLLRHRCVGSRSRSYDSVSLKLHSRFPSQSRRSHIEEEILPLLVLLITTPPSLLLEKEKGNGTSLKKKHTSLRPFEHD